MCLSHTNQIKKALEIAGIASDVCSWTNTNEGKGAQIDLIINRADRVINLCEIKYSAGRYEMTKDYAEWMTERRDLFREETGTNKTLHLTLVSPYGVVTGKNTSILQNVVTLEDLFER